MEVKDFFVTPIVLLILYGIAYMVRPSVTNVYTRPYFIPALTLKLIGAIALGLVYTFYYGGGDTSSYFYQSQVITSGFNESFSVGWKLMMAKTDYDAEIASYIPRFIWYGDAPEYLVSRIAAAIGLFCNSTYSAIAVVMGFMSFTGMWALYITFIKIRPQVYKELAWSVFYIPSLFFWGSGILKDTICLGALGWLMYAFYRGLIQKQALLQSLIIGGISVFLLFRIKVYILLCFLPAAMLWIFNENNARIKNKVIRILAKPLFFTIGAAVAFYAATNLTKGEEYDVENIAEHSKATADALYKTSVSQEGSAYRLGELDGTAMGMVKLAPQAIATSLFRPFIWEVRNPVMLLASLEGAFMLFFTLQILRKTGVARVFTIVSITPSLTLCFVFSLVFAASVGITSNNFGTLVRYKIPMIPFYAAGLYILQSLATTDIGIKKKVAPKQLVNN
jgi:hypothetical protein